MSEPILICAKCKKEFKESEVVIIHYSEHPGAPRTSEDFVSPCCNTYYYDKED